MIKKLVQLFYINVCMIYVAAEENCQKNRVSYAYLKF